MARPACVPDYAPASGAVDIRYRQPSRLTTLRGLTMGTSWSVQLPAGAPAQPGLQAALQQRLDDYNAQVSHWQADSLLSRFNDAPAGSRHPLPTDFAQVIGAALDIAAATGGAFDPALGAIVDLWGFGAGQPVRTPPSANAIANALRHCGWQRLAFDRRTATLIQPGGVRLDLSGIAKGHAVDLLSELLMQRGLTEHLVEVGGELRAAGQRPGGQAWRVAVQGPGADAPPTGITVLLDGGRAIATSGDYLRYFDVDGQRYAHTLDPRVGVPVPSSLASVTVVADDCLRADALATALTVMGADAGFDHACRQQLAALFVLREPVDPRWPRREVFRFKPTPVFLSISEHQA